MSFEPRPYPITFIKQYTKDVKLIRVKTDMNPFPGQFFEVSVFGFGEAPLASCSSNKTYVDMLIRNAGRVTDAIFKYKVGEEMQLRGPYGTGFDLLALKDKNLILIAGGTGIAPVTSLIDHIENNPNQFKKITIFFGFRDEEHILLKEKIEKWNKKFDVTLCLNEKAKKMKVEVGLLPDILKKKKPSTENSAAILCGPEIMMSSVSDYLQNQGLSKKDIYWNMERRMECAIGSCGRCLIQDLYVCRDGPVFRYDVIKPRLDNEASNDEIEVKK